MLILPVKTKGVKAVFIFLIIVKSHPKQTSASCHIVLGPALTSMDVELIPDFPADLGWSDVLFPVQRVHHIQLLLLDQFGDDLDAVPLRQSARKWKKLKKEKKKVSAVKRCLDLLQSATAAPNFEPQLALA